MWGCWNGHLQRRVSCMSYNGAPSLACELWPTSPPHCLPRWMPLHTMLWSGFQGEVISAAPWYCVRSCPSIDMGYISISLQKFQWDPWGSNVQISNISDSDLELLPIQVWSMSLATFSSMYRLEMPYSWRLVSNSANSPWMVLSLFPWGYPVHHSI